ncbi:MAG: hypothetical protein AAFV29_23610, partial [Myxococcota bacterium]
NNSIQKTVLGLGVSFGLAGCFVDLERDEAILQILVDGVDASAQEIIVEVDDGMDDPFVDRFALSSVALSSVDGSQTLPFISLEPGEVTVRGRTVDATGNNVGMPVMDSISLQSGSSGLTLDFSAPPVVPGDDEQIFHLIADVRLDVEPAGAITIPVSQMVWDMASAGLTGTPDRFQVTHITISSQEVDIGEQPDTLDEIFEGTVDMQVFFGGIVRGGVSFVAQDLNSIQLSAPQIDISTWASAVPSDAAVTVSGVFPSDGLEVPILLRVDLEVLAGRN